MGKQINQYTKTRTAATIQGDDLLGPDSTEDAGTTFESAKMKVSEYFTTPDSGSLTLSNAAGNFFKSIDGVTTLDNGGVDALVIGEGVTRGGIVFNAGNANNSTIYDRHDGTFTNGLTLKSRNNIFQFLGSSDSTINANIQAGTFSKVREISGESYHPLVIQGSVLSNDVNDGLHFKTADASNVMQSRFEIQADSSNVNAYFINISNLGINTSSQFGDGDGVLGLSNATSVPTTSPTGGGVLYSEGGALKWKGSSGTVTIIAAA